MNHKPRKRFGQNFLQDQGVIGHIIDALCLAPEDNVVEIGPGKGALTRLLLTYLNKLTVIEIDRDLQAFLANAFNSSSRLQIIGADALTINYHNWGNNLRVVGNLPYNISTPLILHLLSFVNSIKDMHFMLQKEVVERLAAQPGSKDYGRLSIMIQYHCEVTHLFNVPPDAFYPKPKVDSAVVRLTPYAVSPYPPVNLKLLQDLVALAFSMRRKTLANNLKPLISAQELADLAINAAHRPEQIKLIDYIKIANFLSNGIKLN
ncbi:dimethyladenosine transferase (16S rRNA dimethylase) [Legionella beliardensis]|uniref:Ribosomal RNA small subunit methyltransferase A n=1 Tax=Legionella beliardensis TaxID=91822 RepID=A0A378HZ31_9GAMM|nr:16S rRNA (adenine(1518)-N(6)/adenine(1519)-N(6))-dimethyltransferase RsmA [Legionella beliardensis]STX27546.1 dimethyladenosine transferase (16S rRNA dimethylase) [Legionella beliardensis]